MKEYTLRLFTTAFGPAREKSRLAYLNFYGQKKDNPYIVWNIEGADQNILVDSGCSVADYLQVVKEGSEEPLVGGGETFKDAVDVTAFEDGLAKWGLKPEDIDVIILTHLHWDHIMGVKKCKNAKIVVQEKEMRSALHPHVIWKWSYAPRWYYEQMRNLDFVEGDVEFLPGIRLILSPGHTPGGQSVAVNTKEGWYVISGFCAIKENFYPPEDVKKAIGHPVIPVGIHTDPLVAYESALKLVQMFGDKVLACHDDELMKVERIPE